MTVDMGMTWVKYYLHHYDSGHGNDMGKVLSTSL